MIGDGEFKRTALLILYVVNNMLLKEVKFRL